LLGHFLVENITFVVFHMHSQVIFQHLGHSLNIRVLIAKILNILDVVQIDEFLS